MVGSRISRLALLSIASVFFIVGLVSGACSYGTVSTQCPALPVCNTDGQTNCHVLVGVNKYCCDGTKIPTCFCHGAINPAACVDGTYRILTDFPQSETSQLQCNCMYAYNSGGNPNTRRADAVCSDGQTSCWAASGPSNNQCCNGADSYCDGTSGACISGVYRAASSADSYQQACNCKYGKTATAVCSNGGNNCWVSDASSVDRCCESGDNFCSPTGKCVNGVFASQSTPDCNAGDTNCIIPSTSQCCAGGVYAPNVYYPEPIRACCPYIGVASSPAQQIFGVFFCFTRAEMVAVKAAQTIMIQQFYCDDLSDGSWDQPANSARIDISDPVKDMACITCAADKTELSVLPSSDGPADGKCEASCGASAQCDEKTLASSFEDPDGDNTYDNCTSSCSFVDTDICSAAYGASQACEGRLKGSYFAAADHTLNYCDATCQFVSSGICASAYGASPQCEEKQAGGYFSGPDGTKDSCSSTCTFVDGNLCEADYGASPECDGKPAGQSITATTGCDSSCKYRQCGNYKWKDATGCHSSCSSVAECSTDACIDRNCLAESGCSSNQLKECYTSSGRGACAGSSCCKDYGVDSGAGIVSCVTDLKPYPGAQCDYFGDGLNAGNTVKLSPDGTSAGCCSSTKCFGSADCVNSGTLISNAYCDNGNWVLCDISTVCSPQSVGGYYCSYDGTNYVAGTSQLACGSSCAPGSRCDKTAKCAPSAQYNLPIGETCSANGQCCTGYCSSGKCAALVTCSSSTMGSICEKGVGLGVCAADCSAGSCTGSTCCGSPMTAVINSAGQFGCTPSLDFLVGKVDLTGATCDSNFDGSPDGDVRLSFLGKAGCCSGSSCYDGTSCVNAGIVSGTTICVAGKWEECTVARTCEELVFAGEKYFCSSTGWVKELVNENFFCRDKKKVTCEPTGTDTAAIFGKGDSFSSYLCSDAGLEFCNGTVRMFSVGSSSYLCNSTDWVECAGTTAASADSGGYNATDGVISNGLLCSSGLWKPCDDNNEKRAIMTAVGNRVCTSGTWLGCAEGAAYRTTDAASFTCGCSSGKSCIALETKLFGICVNSTCCTGWTDESFGSCWNLTADCSAVPSGTLVDSLADGTFNRTGVCVLPDRTRCNNDGPKGAVVVSLNKFSAYYGSEKCIASARAEYLGFPCDAEPDGAFEGIITSNITANGTDYACTPGVYVAPPPEEEENVTVTEECTCPDDGDVCTDDYCKAEECIHERICETCGNDFCASGECQTCPQDCSAEECHNNVCDLAVGENCKDLDCECTFNYQMPEDTSFGIDESKFLFFDVKNEGNFREKFTVYIDGVKYELDANNFTLDPGASKRIRIKLLEESPGAYLFEVNVKPEHGNEYTKSVLAVVKGELEKKEVPFVATDQFKYGVTFGIIIIGLGAAAFFFSKLKGKVEDMQMNRNVYGQTPYGGNYQQPQQGYSNQPPQQEQPKQ